MNIGKIGENIAKNYLIQKGFKILQTNFYSIYGEIDIICENLEYIVFIEVKTKTDHDFFYACERVNSNKKKKILKTIEVYFSKNHTHKQPRIDVIEVILKSNKFIINHFSNAF